MTDSKVVLVVGGHSGIGLETAIQCKQHGHQVVIADIHCINNEARDDGMTQMFVDVTLRESWELLLANVISLFGRVDSLVNAAGVFKRVKFPDFSDSDFRGTVDVNQLGVALGMAVIAPSMQERGGGSIVNVSSIAAVRGAARDVLYTGSKWAVRGMSRSAARLLAPFQVRVNCVFPGYTETPMLTEVHSGDAHVLQAMIDDVPLGRLAKASDLAAAILFFAVGDSTYCTGSELVVDGGVTA